MKSVIFFTLFLLGIQFSGLAQTAVSEVKGLEWHTDLAKARELSDATKKPIFGFFTGSDWCGWCRKIQSDVFEKDAFIEWAKKNVILLELDFPRRKQLPIELVQQNQSLQQAFNIKGYPTIWLFYVVEDQTTHNLSLTALGSLGYPQGSESGKEALKFVADANVVLAKGKN